MDMKFNKQFVDGFSDDKTTLKNEKPFKKFFEKATVAGLVAGMIAGALFGLAGCGDGGHSAGNLPTPPIPDSDTPELPPIAVEDATLEDLVSDYHNQAVNFVIDNIEEKVVGTRDLVSREVTISANSKNEINRVDYAYTYKEDETKRAFSFASVEILNPVDIDKIIDGELLDDVQTVVTQNDIFKFDAFVNKERQDFSAAAKKTLEKFYDVKLEDDVNLYSQGVSVHNNNYAFSVLDVSEKEVNVYSFDVVRSVVDTEENLLKNMDNSIMISNFEDDKYEMEGVNIISDNYIQNYKFYSNNKE